MRCINTSWCRSKDNFVLQYYAAVTMIGEQKLKEKNNGKLIGGLLNTKKGGNK